MAKSKKGLSPVLSWVLVMGALGLVGWIWWQAGLKSEVHQLKSEPQEQAAAKAKHARPPETDQSRLARDEGAKQGTRGSKPEANQPKPEDGRARLSADTMGRAAAPVSQPPPPTNRLAGIHAEYAALKANRDWRTNTPAAFVPRLEETNAPALQPDGFPRPVQDIFEAQLALDRQGISSGSLDGQHGSQTRAALRAYQRKMRLPVTGELDATTRTQLLLTAPPYRIYTVTADDLADLQPLSSTWLGKSQQSALAYETVLEMVAEKGHAHPNLIRRLNPGINWARVPSGTVVHLPDAEPGEFACKAAFVTIRLTEKVLEAFDANAQLLAHFPCSIAQRVEKRPEGELHVAVIAPNPNYTFNPEIFPESEEARHLKAKLVLPPGPNNPVGVAWIGLDKPGYGIHGTPSPEQVGRTESHGCFRLANWNAECLLDLVWVGMPVHVVK